MIPISCQKINLHLNFLQKKTEQNAKSRKEKRITAALVSPSGSQPTLFLPVRDTIQNMATVNASSSLDINVPQIHGTSTKVANDSIHASNIIFSESIDNVDNPVCNNDWKKVNRKRCKTSRIIGTGDIVEDIAIVQKLKWMHLSRLDVGVSGDSIAKFISSKVNFPANQIICKNFVKKDEDISKLKFLTFKSRVPNHISGKIFNASFWPSGIYVCEFKIVPKNSAEGPLEVA